MHLLFEKLRRLSWFVLFGRLFLLAEMQSDDLVEDAGVKFGRLFMSGLGAGLFALDGDSLELTFAVFSDKRLGHHFEVPLKLFSIVFK